MAAPTTTPKQKILIDVSQASQSSQVMRMLEDYLPEVDARIIDLNVGDVLLNRGVLAKIQNLCEQQHIVIATLYAGSPQTQQSALDEGMAVKRQLDGHDAVATITFFNQADPEGATLNHFDKLAEGLTDPTLQFLKEESVTDAAGVSDVTIGTIDVEQRQPVLFDDQDLDTLYLKQNIRSGQMVQHNGNIIILGDVHAGAEVIAGGDIVVWGDLRGIAHAGKRGLYQAEIRAMSIEALQLRIADYVARRPDRIAYHKGTDSKRQMMPELAKVADGEIKIYTAM